MSFDRVLGEAVNDEIHGLSLWKSLSTCLKLLTVGSVRSEYTPVEIYTSVTYLPKGKGQLLGWKGSSMVVESGSSEALAEGWLT